MGWSALSNGLLLTAAEAAGFDILITADRNLSYQQNLAARRIAIVVLTNNHWLTVKAEGPVIAAACNGAAQGAFIVIELPKPPLRRRPPPSPTF
jgi:hypothetical protein